MLDLRRLRLLHELQSRGTITAVAGALGYTPSAVSQQLAALEREAGVALLEPAGRGVRLTDAGHVLAGHAATMLRGLEAAMVDLAAASGQVAGTVRVASFQTGMLRIVTPALDAIAESYPDVRLEIVEAEVEEALPALRAQSIDLMVGDEYEGSPRPRYPTIVRERLLREQMLVILPADHPLASLRRVTLAKLRDAAWASGKPGSAHREELERVCRARGGFDPDVRHSTNELLTLLTLVRTGRAVSFLPRLGLPTTPEPDLIGRPAAEGEMWREVFVAYRAGGEQRPALAAVLSAVRAAARKIPAVDR